MPSERLEEWHDVVDAFVTQENCEDVFGLMELVDLGPDTWEGRSKYITFRAKIRKAELLNHRREVAMVAGLRLLQIWGTNPAVSRAIEQGDPYEVDDIVSDGGTVKPLTSEEIDDLCELINSLDGFQFRK